MGRRPGLFRLSSALSCVPGHSQKEALQKIQRSEAMIRSKGEQAACCCACKMEIEGGVKNDAASVDAPEVAIDGSTSRSSAGTSSRDRPRASISIISCTPRSSILGRRVHNELALSLPSVQDHAQAVKQGDGRDVVPLTAKMCCGPEHKLV